MSRVLQIVERPPLIAQIYKCQNYTATFHTLQQDRSNYHQHLYEQQIPLLSTIYSYKRISSAKSTEQANNVAQANLQRRIDDKAQLSRLGGTKVQPHVSNLELHLSKYQFESSEVTRLDIEKRIHHNPFTAYDKWQAHSKAHHAYTQLLYETNYLSAIIPDIHKNFREMYAMTLQHTAIRLIRNSRQLKPYILYQHTISSYSIESYPLKFDATRASPSRARTLFLKRFIKT